MARLTLDLEWDLRRAIAEAIVRERLDPRRVFLFAPGSEALASSRDAAWVQGERFRCALLLGGEPPPAPFPAGKVSFSSYRKTPSFAAEVEGLLPLIPAEIVLDDALGGIRPVELVLPSGWRASVRWRDDGGIAVEDPEDGRVLRDIGA
ncbi:MAG: hypothetical protein JXP34_16875 [Planctomycetes bacterium]|nr:hypothetical protein [Planctomycetota bacterium]